MASEKDLELLDQYVSNRLASQDKIAFEHKLQLDSSLKNEYAIQKRVVEKIREARVKELKTMFNNVPAAELETTGNSVVTQVALWVVVAGAVGTGLYFYLNNQDKVESQSIAQQEEVLKEAPATIQPQQQEPKQEGAVVQQENKDPKGTTPAEGNVEKTEEQALPHGVVTDQEPKGPAALDVFDPTKENDNSTNENPEVKISRESSPANRSSIVVELDNSSNKYSFHYQFKNGKLHLYGAFEKNLYEIMEFFSDNKRTVFLFYKDSYYLLNEENENVKPLSPINDPTLLKKLKDYRGTR